MRDHRALDASIRVLCVGTDAYLTDLMRYALTREGCAVEVASSGAEAAAIAERWRPHEAIVDCDSPDLGGHDLYTQLRKGYGTAVLLLAAGGGEDAQAPGRTPAGSRQLTKPFSLRTLVWILNAMLQPTVR
jgi:two-component system OmpR family response regulator